MVMQNRQEYINILRSLFKGREDVFALRWEKGSKSGYMPAINQAMLKKQRVVIFVYSSDSPINRIHLRSGR
jgi:hypothetical protein